MGRKLLSQRYASEYIWLIHWLKVSQIYIYIHICIKERLERRNWSESWNVKFMRMRTVASGVRNAKCSHKSHKSNPTSRSHLTHLFFPIWFLFFLYYNYSRAQLLRDFPRPLRSPLSSTSSSCGLQSLALVFHVFAFVAAFGFGCWMKCVRVYQ